LGRGVLLYTLMGLMACIYGCSSIDSLLIPLLPETDAQSAEMTPPDSPSEKVTILFQNLSTTDAVDVQFFFIETNVLDAMNELFVEANAVSRTIGVAGTGILEPERSDLFELPCSTELTLGTAGGNFFDNDTGDPTGTGTPRWVQDSGLGLCRSVVTFVFSDEGDVFTTNITIERP